MVSYMKNRCQEPWCIIADMVEKGRQYEDNFERASSGQILGLIMAIDSKIPTAVTLDEYAEASHQLLHPEVQRLFVKRGKYNNGFAQFDGASVDITRAQSDLPEQTERWNIWKAKGEYTVSRLVLPSEVDNDHVYAESVVFQRMVGLNVVSSEEAKTMHKILKEAAVF